MSEAVRKASPGAEVVCRPMSDGGEGFAEMWRTAGRTERLVESSALVGLHSYPIGLPLMQRSSYDLGQAVVPGETTYVTVGGTGVCDGGAGFLQGLGVKFYEADGRLIETPLTPDTLCRVARADTTALAAYDLKGIIDVKASLTGPGLSALDFARQKALPNENLTALKPALENLQSVLGGASEYDGAGGGLGYALASVIGCECVSGAEFAVSLIEPLLNSGRVELVITGEGCVDRQTVEGGKLPDAVYRAATGRGIPVLIVGGRIEVPGAYPQMCKLKDFDLCIKKLLSPL